MILPIRNWCSLYLEGPCNLSHRLQAEAPNSFIYSEGTAPLMETAPGYPLYTNHTCLQFHKGDSPRPYCGSPPPPPPRGRMASSSTSTALPALGDPPFPPLRVTRRIPPRAHSSYCLSPLSKSPLLHHKLCKEFPLLIFSFLDTQRYACGFKLKREVYRAPLAGC